MPIFIFSTKYRENTNEFLKNTGEPMPKFSIFAEYDMNTGKEQVRVTNTHEIPTFLKNAVDKRLINKQKSKRHSSLSEKYDNIRKRLDL